MANVVIKFPLEEQRRIASIVIDQDKDEALRFLAELLGKIKEHPGHACGPKVVR
jgi:hypothetical protein